MVAWDLNRSLVVVEGRWGFPTGEGHPARSLDGGFPTGKPHWEFESVNEMRIYGGGVPLILQW